MALFSDYTDLRLNVIRTLKRNYIDPDLSRLTLIAEDRLNRRIRHNDMLKIAPVTMTNGSGTLPTDYLEMQHLYTASGRELKELSLKPDDVNIYREAGYYVEGLNLMYGGASTQLSASYYSKLPTLITSATGTNWLLQKHPSVYLYAICCEAMDLDDARLDAFESRRDREIMEIKIDSDRRQYGNASVHVSGVPS